MVWILALIPTCPLGPRPPFALYWSHPCPMPGLHPILPWTTFCVSVRLHQSFGAVDCFYYKKHKMYYIFLILSNISYQTELHTSSSHPHFSSLSACLLLSPPHISDAFSTECVRCHLVSLSPCSFLGAFPSLPKVTCHNSLLNKYVKAMLIPDKITF